MKKGKIKLGVACLGLAMSGYVVLAQNWGFCSTQKQLYCCYSATVDTSIPSVWLSFCLTCTSGLSTGGGSGSWSACGEPCPDQHTACASENC